jgi:lysophospholipase L1-like esterase
MTQYNNRREFIKNTLLLGAVATVTPGLLKATPHIEVADDEVGKGYTFLFQGDSITDGNRTRNNDWNHVMGHGFAYLISSRLWFGHPKQDFHFFNRGISGNKVTDLAARWQTDTLDLKPNLLSILVGINDISSFINGDKNFSTEHYESNYRSLLQQTKEQLPGVQFVLCEPFILPVGRVKDKWDTYVSEVEKRRQVVRKLSAEFDAVFVEFQSAFDKAISKAPAEYWIWDGIHPMPAGHELMAREWIRQVSKRIKFIG